MSKKENEIKGIGRITTKKSGGNGYKSYWIYIPSKIAKNQLFPFSDGDKVEIELSKTGRLLVCKHDKLKDIINQYGLENATLPKVLEEKSKRNKNRPFLYFKDKIYSYRALNNKANQIAHGIIRLLEDMGIRKPGRKLKRTARIAAMLPNCPDFIFAWFGISKTRCTYIPINPHLKGNFLSQMLQDIEPEVLIIDYSYLDNFKEIYVDILKIQKVIVHNPPEDFEPDSIYLSFTQFISSNEQNPEPEVKDLHEMEIIYTAGTTGKPKGLLFRNYYVLTGVNVGKEMQDMGFNKDSIIYCPLPLSHALGQLLTILPAIFYDASIVITEDFNPKEFWANVEKYKISGLVYFRDFLKQLINQKPTKKDRQHTIKWAFGFGATKNLWETFEKRFGIPIYEGWAQTEAAGITINKVGSQGEKMGSVGKPVSGYELKIVDSEGNILPPGKENIGQMMARSTIPIPLEYFNKEDAKPTTTNSWIETGDYGYKDGDGFYYYVGRESDMLKMNGKVFFATEIEKVVNSHPFILESAAFSIQDKGREEIKLCIVLKKPDSLSFEEIYNYLSRNLAGYMVPRYIELKKQLPRSVNNFICKYLLKKEWDNTTSQANTWDANTKTLLN